VQRWFDTHSGWAGGGVNITGLAELIEALHGWRPNLLNGYKCAIGGIFYYLQTPMYCISITTAQRAYGIGRTQPNALTYAQWVNETDRRMATTAEARKFIEEVLPTWRDDEVVACINAMGGGYFYEFIQAIQPEID
jgi:hypothetical protein